MKVILGLLFLILSSSCNSIEDEDEDEDKDMFYRMLDKYGRISKPVRKVPNYLKGEDLRTCKRCGLINSGKKNYLMINGDIVKPSFKYPWMVRLNGPLMCGGAILNEYYILTAAHCFLKSLNPKNPNFLKLAHPRQIKVYYLTATYSLRRGPQIRDIIPHPEFNWLRGKNDIGLVKLKEKIICDKFKNPICLPPHNFKIPKGMAATAAGWGLVSPRSKSASRELREGLVKYTNFAKCHYVPPRFEETLYCFEGRGGKNKWQGTCYGDSGGPAFYERKKKFYVIGITSRGSVDCAEGQAFLFTIVPKYVRWIKKVTKIK